MQSKVHYWLEETKTPEHDTKVIASDVPCYLTEEHI